MKKFLFVVIMAAFFSFASIASAGSNTITFRPQNPTSVAPIIFSATLAKCNTIRQVGAIYLEVRDNSVAVNQVGSQVIFSYFGTLAEGAFTNCEDSLGPYFLPAGSYTVLLQQRTTQTCCKEYRPNTLASVPLTVLP